MLYLLKEHLQAFLHVLENNCPHLSVKILILSSKSRFELVLDDVLIQI